MQDVVYDIMSFTWLKVTNTFYANACNTYPMGDYFKCSWPNARKQFYILNTNTGNKCRFTLSKESKEVWYFLSEGGIGCSIKLKEM